MFELFDHTADVGLRVRAPSLAQLMEEAARGLFSLIVANPEAIRPVLEETICLAPESPDYLMQDWLTELLYRFDDRRWLGAEFTVRLSPTGLEAQVAGEIWDPQRQTLAHEVKAVTYHGLRVESTGTDWLAEVIFDI